MTTAYLRPGHLHTASRVLSCSDEQGLTVGPAVESSSNDGYLRLRTSGVPAASTSLVAYLIGGGGPFGYATSGASAAWRFATDTTSQYRGYNDTPHLVRVESPVTTTGVTTTSTPRTLANGALGFLTEASGAVAFRSFSAAGVTTTVTAGLAAATSGHRPDLVKLPSGRLIALTRQTNDILTRYSDDNGATWAALGQQTITPAGGTWDVICAEYASDMIVMILGDSTGVLESGVFVSRDGGVTWTTINTTSQILRNPRTCVIDDVVLIVEEEQSVLNTVLIYKMIPGGDMSSTSIDTGLTMRERTAIVTRDDGVVWCFAWVSAANVIDCDAAYSKDGGTTWTDVGQVLDTEFAATTDGYSSLSAGVWRGSVITLGTSESASGTNGKVHMMTWGGWSSVTGTVDQNFTHTYVPIDLPENMGWTRTNTAAGATATNDGPLQIVSTAANNSSWAAPAAFWGPAAGDQRRCRFRVRVNSGGSIADNRSRVSFSITDGANEQSVNIRFSSTQFRAFDGAGNSLGTTSITAGVWYDFEFAMTHDTTPGAGVCALYYRADTDAFGLWSDAFTNATIVEILGVDNSLRIGGAVAGAADWEFMLVEVADSQGGLAAGFSNPADLYGRPLSSVYDYFAVNGINVGARNTGGVPTDTYTVATTYTHGKENIWREIRPSRQVRSNTDGGSWNVVFDAGANDQFKGDMVALFGINFRTATLQMNATDAWGAPSVSVSLDATVWSGTVGAGVRGPGYVGPTTSPNWRPGQFASDGDAHRWFVLVGEAVYEITDNDESRIYVANVDFSAAAGDLKVFQDKTAATFTFGQYRFMRLLVGAQATADDEYRCGTVIVDKRLELPQSYDYGYVRRVEPNVEVFTGDAGYQANARVGPRKSVLQIQWPPVDQIGPSTDLDGRLRDFYKTLEGAPFALWTLTSDIQTLHLFRFDGAYQTTNIWGEHTNEITRIDQLVLSEVF